jgi:pimeloyl-ACP methyl ester carboxylesterase
MKKTFLSIFWLFLTIIIGFCTMGYRSDIPIEILREKYATPPSKFIEVNNLQVHYRDEGLLNDSIPLVLVHGTSSSLFTWDAWVQALDKDFRIIRMDLPNYALTGSDGHTLYMGPDYAEFLGRFLDKLGVKKCYLAGNSLGGEVTWQFARLYPNRVEKIILIDAAGIPMASKSKPLGFLIAQTPVLCEIAQWITPYFIFEKSIRNVYADPQKVTDATIQQYLDMTLRAGNRVALMRKFQKDKLPYDNHRSELPNIQTPTMLLWGAKDELIPVEAGYKFQEAMPNDTLVVFSNAGHVPMEELGTETADLALKWLKKK